MADTPAAGGACTTAGQTANNPDANGTMNILWCNGTTWQNASIKVGKTVPVCDSTSEGTISYDSLGKAFTFCNGSNFVPFNSAAGTAIIKTSLSSAAFYPTASSCSAPSCGAGYTSQGCTFGSATNLLADLTLDYLVKTDLVSRMTSTGFVSSCSPTTVPTVGLFNKIICARLCKQN